MKSVWLFEIYQAVNNKTVRFSSKNIGHEMGWIILPVWRGDIIACGIRTEKGVTRSFRMSRCN